MPNRLAYKQENSIFKESQITKNGNTYAFNIGITPVFNATDKNIYADLKISFTYNAFLADIIRPATKIMAIYIVPQYSNFYNGAICSAQATRKNLAGYCYAVAPSSGKTENWYIHNVLLPNTNFNIFHYWLHPSGYHEEAWNITKSQIIEICPYNYFMERI